MKDISVKALAKINLGLDVVRKREDGYHEVRMVMQTNLERKMFGDRKEIESRKYHNQWLSLRFDKAHQILRLQSIQEPSP